MNQQDAWQRRVDELWDSGQDPAETLAAMLALAAELPSADPRGPFELGGAYDSAGSEAEAAAEYERAIELGLAGPERAQLDVQYASTLRNLGRFDEAVAVLSASEPDASVGAAREAFLALCLHSAGRVEDALAVALEALEPTLPRYRRSLTAYAAELRAGGSAPR